MTKSPCFFAKTLTFFLLPLFLALPFKAGALDQTTANALAASMLSASGRHCALIAVPNCLSGELAIGFWNQASDSHLVVDGFESDPTLLATAQQNANALGLLGRNLYMRSGSLSLSAYSMPYADHFVDLVAVTNLADADFANISYTEMERVLCTSGQARLGRAASEGAGLSTTTLTAWISGTHALSTATVVSDATGTWAVITKISRLPNTYEGGASITNAGNRFYNDQVATWPTLPQWAGKPYGGICSNGKNKLFNWGCLAKICIGGGRMYGFDDNNPNALCALRVQNGHLLWTIPGLDMHSPGGIQAFSKGVVYGNEIIAGETGVVAGTIPLPADWNNGATSYQVANDILYAVGTGSSGVNTLFAYDLVNCVTVYSTPNFCNNEPISSYYVGWMMGELPCVVMSGSVLYATSGTTVYCYNTITGSKNWGPVAAPTTVSSIEASPNGVLLIAGNAPTLEQYFLAVANGALLWGPKAVQSAQGFSDIVTDSSLNGGKETICSICGSQNSYDLLTGSFAGSVGNFGAGQCAPGASEMPAGFFARRSGISWSAPLKASSNSDDPFASDCTDSPCAASGMIIYKDKWCNCSCYGLFRGTTAQAPLGSFNPEQTAVQSQRLQQGPAYGGNLNVQVVPDALDWPTHRANMNRSGYVPVPIVTNSSVQLWKYTNPTPNTWNRDLYDDFCTYHDVTPPVTAGGYTYLAGSDGVVKCLNNNTGSLVWSFPTGGWIFATPTVANGCVYVGSGDGYAYCLEAQTGRLVWSFRAAPAERRFNYYGHLISTWPITTGVLVHPNGNAYFVSGILGEYGVQAYAVNALTGAIVWQNTACGVCFDNRPGLARVGLWPGGYMTVVGNYLMVKETTHAYANSAAGIDVFDLNTGAISPLTSAYNYTKYTQNPYEGYWSGRQIGVMGNYLVGWGEDLHTEMEYELYGGDTAFTKFDVNANPITPVLVWGNVTESGRNVNALVWDGTEAFLDQYRYELTGTGGMLAALNNLVANPPGQIQNPAVPCTTAYGISASQVPKTSSSQWQPVLTYAQNAAAALTSNCLVTLTQTGTVSVMNRVTGLKLGSFFSGGAPYLQGLAVDRAGRIVVANRVGDVVCFGTPLPVVVTPPASMNGVAAGSMVTFSVEAAGAGLSYQWRFNGVNIAGGTNATYTINSVTNSNAGYYDVVLTNSNGSITSPPATLTLAVSASLTSPTIGQMFSQPNNGQPAAITLSATATSTLGTITQVFFYSGTTQIGVSTTAPYSYNWSAMPGTYTVSCTAYDNLGNAGSSVPVNITVAALVVHYNFDETTGTLARDSSGNSYNGTAHASSGGVYPSWVAGLFNGSICFTDTTSKYQGVMTGPVSVLTSGSSFTVAFWLCPSGPPSSGQQPICCGATSGTSYGRLMDNGYNGQPCLTWYSTSGTSTKLNSQAQSHNYTPGVWYHYAFTVTPQAVNWYIDGSLFVTLTPPTGQTLVTSMQNFGFGNAYPAVAGGGFYGLMDEARIYNQAISAADIMALATTNVPYTSPSPTISLTSPTNGTMVTATNSVPLAVTIGTCSHYPLTVNYYANGSLIGSSGTAPYGFTWNNVPRGSYAVTAVAMDGLGQTGTSNVANVTFSYVTEPVINLAGGIYLNAQNVVVTCTDPTATIYFTTNGSTPTTSSSSVLSGGSILVNKTMILEVEAFKSGMYPSELQTFMYRIGGALAAGYDHSLMVDSVAPLWAWGFNGDGELGDGTTMQRNSPVCISNSCSANMFGISAGNMHSLGVASDGSVWAWGYNSNGQLGIGSTTEQNSPVKLSGVTNALSVAAGSTHSLAVKADGTVWAWGQNSSGQLGDNTVTQRTSPVQTGSGVLTNIVAVAAGSSHSLALKSDGTVWAWGANYDGQLGNGTTTSGSTPVQVSGLSGTVVAIAAGREHSLAIKNDGTVWAWGQNSSGQLGDGTTTQRSTPVQATVITSAIAISGGESHTLALKSDGTVWAWGGNSDHQLGDGTTNGRTTPAQVSGLSNITTLAAGCYQSLALGNDGSVWAWGNNSNGQLGNGTTTNLTVPTVTSGPSSPYVLFTVGAETCSQAAGPINITVQLDAPAAASVTVPFTKGGTAVTGTDYTISGSSVVIPAGQTSGTIVITPINNSYYRGTRTIVLTMGTPTNATIGLTTINTVTLTDVNPMPTLSFVSGGMSQAENSGTAYLVAQLSASSGLTTTMPFSCAGTAVAGTNYTITGSSVTIPAGHLSGTIAVRLINWTPYQGNQTLIVNMGTLTNATLGSITSETLTILDVNPMPISLTSLLSNQTVAWGQQATFSVLATGSTPAYQWSKNGKAISGATNASYTTGSAGVSDNGNVFTVVVRNAVSSATSSATLVVLCNAPPTVSIFQPANGAVISPAPANVTIATNISSAVVSVEFLSGTTVLGQSTGNTFAWSSVTDGTYTLTAQVTDNEGQTAISAPVSITVSGSTAVSGTSYAAWVAAHNLSGVSALEVASPACDGVANLVKYALGLDPCSACGKVTDGTWAGLPLVTGSGTGMSMTYQADTAKTDITYTVEASTDLVTWTTMGITSGTLSTNGTVQTIQANVPISGRKMFLHLRVTK